MCMCFENASNGLGARLRRLRVQGCHCGAPNIARCRAGAAHECLYIGMDELDDNFPTQCPTDAIMTSSIGGITEYNSYEFGGVSKDKVYVSGYKKHLVRYDPAGDKQVTDEDDAFYPASPGLDVIHAPGGVHIVASMEASKLLINIPVDATLAASGNPSVYDIKPDRGMKEQPGPNTFVLGGANFDAIKGLISCIPVLAIICASCGATSLRTRHEPRLCNISPSTMSARYTNGMFHS